MAARGAGPGSSQRTGHAFTLGNGSESASWVLEIKENPTKQQAGWQLWLRLRIGDTGTSMRDRVEEPGAAGNLWPQLEPSQLGSPGDEAGLALSLAPKSPLQT